MSLSKEKIDLLKTLSLTTVVSSLSQERNMTPEEALRWFAQTKTFDLLQSDEGLLYLESDEYILDMLRCELEGDWKRWCMV